MNMMTYLRLKNILGNDEGGGNNDVQNIPLSSFGPGGMGDVGGLDNQDDDSDNDQTDNSSVPSHMDIASRMNQLYQPKNTATQAFSDQLNNQPNRNDYQAGKGRKLLGFIAGLGAGAGPAGIDSGQAIGFHGNPNFAYDMASKITNAPYNAAEGEYEQKLKPLAIAASQEEKNNTNNRIAANNALSREISQERANNQAEDIKRKDRLDQSTMAHRKANEELAQKRIDAKNFAQSHPNMKSFTGKDGFVYFIDPQNPSRTIKTDIQSDKLSDFDKLAIRHSNTLDEIGARNTNANDLEDKRQGNRLQLKGTSPAPRPETDITDTTESKINADKTGKVTTHTRVIKPKVAGGVNQSDNTPLPLVPPDKRIIGKIYMMGNGKPGKWMGSGFVSVSQ
jgi:hypothetical protein